ncbi:MAG: ABC transporter permease, partial [Salinibacter sp.]
MRTPWGGYAAPPVVVPTPALNLFPTDDRSAVFDSLLSPLRALGRYAILIGRAFASIDEIRMYWKNLFIQMVRIGIDSIPIVALAAAFSGAVLTVQTAYQLETPFIPKSIIGSIVAPSIMLELGVVVAGF